ncbi:MAG: HlyD family secretion protein [Bacteroidota bacterium]|jgi:adhesin transport system membrane fusion protein
MLNISQSKIKGNFEIEKYHSFNSTLHFSFKRNVRRTLLVLLVAFVFALFLPWTQNVSGFGNVTSLQPEQRPQTLHSVIGGRIEKWYVKEGQLVKKGDTILRISEIKDEYFDPRLLERTGAQLTVKEKSAASYFDKVNSLDRQIDALGNTRELKLSQAKNYLKQAKLKVNSDSIELVAAKVNFTVATEQFSRLEKLYKDGLKSLTDLEGRKLKLQETQAKLIACENKLLQSKNEYINAEIELTSIDNQFMEKLSKAESDKFSALSGMYDAEQAVIKIQNQYSNYSFRRGLYFLTAPQDGYITKALKTGLGEIIKEGEELVSIMPANYELAVEMYVVPVDLPLIHKGQKVRFRFDGWPGIVFSGWPQVSYGTFGGEVVAIDNFISENGKFRILVAPDPTTHPWPKGLRIGGGALCMALLKDVPIWYETWRNINGFPPDYYEEQSNKGNKEKSKK